MANEVPVVTDDQALLTLTQIQQGMLAFAHVSEMILKLKTVRAELAATEKKRDDLDNEIKRLSTVEAEYRSKENQLRKNLEKVEQDANAEKIRLERDLNDSVAHLRESVSLLDDQFTGKKAKAEEDLAALNVKIESKTKQLEMVTAAFDKFKEAHGLA